jgi:UTP-glucose-1-phosphate uridylyltransferase
LSQQRNTLVFSPIKVDAKIYITQSSVPGGRSRHPVSPATKAQPKEMLPVVDKPLIQYAVEEAYAAGIRHMIFVTGRNKRAIEDHFDTAYELENELEVAQKHALWTWCAPSSPTT